jgi:subtilisin family serine protease
MRWRRPHDNGRSLAPRPLIPSEVPAQPLSTSESEILMSYSRVLRLGAALLAGFLLTQPGAQTRQRIDSADQMPRFTYAVQGSLEAAIRDDAKFAALAGQMRRDVESLLRDYDIAEKATRRQLLELLTQLDLVEGRYDDALAHSAQVRALQDRPASKLLSGLSTRAVVAAARRAGNRTSPAYRDEVARAVRAELEGLPYGEIQEDIRAMRTYTEMAGEARLLGPVRDQLQPLVDRSGTLSSELAPALIRARYGLDVLLPIRDALVGAYAGYLSAHKVDKADIWAARSVDLPPGRAWAPVPVVVWDAGVDTGLFADRLITEGGRPAFIAFDRYNQPSALTLRPITPALRAKMGLMNQRSKGISDSLAGIDSPAATEVKRFMSGLPADQTRQLREELNMLGEYNHGTHVAGIALAGNPYARLAQARIEWSHTVMPDPCPTREWAQRAVAAYAADVAFMKRVGARVVNMSWEEGTDEVESALELCGMGGDATARKTLARDYHQLMLDGFVKAVASAPDILFIAAAGNSANDPTFNKMFPSGVVLPNLVTVGAVDKSGDEASFTSYGPTVALHANGYQVESVVPGGTRLAFSGTSMAAPQVTNLAAKMLAIKPSLQPAEVIQIMRATADRTADGRRTLIHPARALAAVGYAP